MLLRTLVCLFGLAWALTACSLRPAPQVIVASPTPEPTRTPTPVVPTATPKPADILRAALKRTRALKTYQIEYDINVLAPAPDGTQEISMIDFTASFAGADVAFEEILFENDPKAQPQPIIIIDGVAYAHGPLPLAGADQPIWYRLGEDAVRFLQPQLTADTILERLFAKIDLAQFTLDGEEMIDGQSCNRYQGGEHAALRFVDTTGTPTTPEAIEREKLPVEQRISEDGITLSDPDARIWVCADGFLRRLESHLSLTSKDAATPVNFSFMLAIEQPNGKVVIEAPADAMPLENTTLTATVFNGGNVREQPSLDGRVLDQINANELVKLNDKTADGKWYRITNIRGIVGWVSVTLLTIEPEVAERVPVDPQ